MKKTAIIKFISTALAILFVSAFVFSAINYSSVFANSTSENSTENSSTLLAKKDNKNDDSDNENENGDKLVDGNKTTNWRQGEGNWTVIMKADSKVRMAGYSLTTGNTVSENHRAVDSQGAGCRLGNRCHVQYFVIRDPVQFITELLSHHTDDDKSAAERKRGDHHH